MPQHAIIYTRFSPRPNGAECDSIALQLERCRAYCEAFGHVVVAEYEDREASGASMIKRDGFKKAIAHACKVKGLLVCLKLDRMVRNVIDALNVLDQLKDHGAGLCFVMDGIDTSGPLGRAFFTVMAAFAELERNIISQRTSNAMLMHQANGRRMGREDCPPFGWKSAGKRLVKNEEEQRTLKFMRRMRSQGFTHYAIAQTLNELGYKSRGTEWRPKTVSRIIIRANRERQILARVKRETLALTQGVADETHDVTDEADSTSGIENPNSEAI